MYNSILVKITGKNISNYLKWLIDKRINFANLKIVRANELIIKINNKDLNKLKKYSKTYKVVIIKKYGKLKLIDIIKKNLVILVSLLFSIFLIYLLSNIIFSVEIIYNNQKIVNTIKNELAKYNIKKYTFKKDYNYLNQVKQKILKDNSDTLEWLEIEESGTKYIVRLVERKKEKLESGNLYQSITSKKDAMIVNIKASSGEKLKNINDYVRKGEEIISGKLLKSDNTIYYEKAEGMVLGEIWYKVSIEYPLYYYEEKITGKNKTVIAINFINHQLPLLPYQKYKEFNTHQKVILSSPTNLFQLLKVKVYEINIKEYIYTPEQAAEKAISLTKDKIKEKNKEIIEIKTIKILNREVSSSKIKLNLFVSTIENITDIIPITPEEEQ